jgi:hypothetical protein
MPAVPHAPDEELSDASEGCVAEQLAQERQHLASVRADCLARLGEQLARATETRTRQAAAEVGGGVARRGGGQLRARCVDISGRQL